MKRFAAFQLPLLLYAGLIFAVSSISRLPEPEIGIEFLDKLAHFAEYFIFLLLAIRAFGHLPALQGKTATYLPAVALSLLFAASDEYHQSFVPGRQADVYDLISDSAGITLAALLHYLMVKRKAAKSSYPG